jgi:DNA-binding CsgD family transcriptional regulator
VIPDEQATTLPRVGQALGRLRGAASVQVLFELTASALCESVGFERTAVFRLHGRALEAVAVAPSSREEPPLELEPGLCETEVLRRRKAMVCGGGSFVAAPIVWHEQAVGLMRADRGPAGVTELDRDTLAVFAEGLGHALERCVLAARFRAQSERVVALARSAQASIGADDGYELALHSRAVPRSANGHGLNGRLTRRELEVLTMLVEGETNAGIAERLVVSEDTVKSHVKHILRKLGVRNRSQAVSCYFQAQGAS